MRRPHQNALIQLRRHLFNCPFIGLVLDVLNTGAKAWRFEQWGCYNGSTIHGMANEQCEKALSAFIENRMKWTEDWFEQIFSKTKLIKSIYRLSGFGKAEKRLASQTEWVENVGASHACILSAAIECCTLWLWSMWRYRLINFPANCM